MLRRLGSFSLYLAAVGSLCLPAAAAPTLTVSKGGAWSNSYLDVNGNWVWNIRISNSSPVPTGSASLSAELGFTATGAPSSPASQRLLSATNLSTGGADDFYQPQPAAPIFGWEQLTDIGGQMKAVGLQTNCASGCTVTGSENQVFSSLSSQAYTTVGPRDYIQIVTRGPSSGPGGNTISTLTVSGSYAGMGRISERDSGGNVVDYDIFANVFTRSARPGDADLNGSVNDGDLGLVLANFGSTNKRWFEGNFNNHISGVTDDSDLNVILANFGFQGPVGAAAGTAIDLTTAVPEPSIVALLGLATLLCVPAFRCTRCRLSTPTY